MYPAGARSSTTRYPWRVLWTLLVAGVLAGVAAIPYLLEIFGERISASGGLPVSLPILLAMQAMQLALVFGFIVSIGLFLAGKVGLPTPLLNSWFYRNAEPVRFQWRAPLVAGIAAGTLVLSVVYVFMARRVPGWPNEARIPTWKRLGAALYGGVDEELLMRLFFFAVVLWIVQKLRRSAPRDRKTFWIANAVVALLFGLAYLPAAAAIVPLTSLVNLSIVPVNFVAGLLFGYVCWNHGLEAAILAHFIANLIEHFIGPIFAG